MNDINPDDYTIVQLRKWLRSVNQHTSGNKAALVLRLNGIPVDERGVCPNEDDVSDDEEENIDQEINNGTHNAENNVEELGAAVKEMGIVEREFELLKREMVLVVREKELLQKENELLKKTAVLNHAENNLDKAIADDVENETLNNSNDIFDRQLLSILCIEENKPNLIIGNNVKFSVKQRLIEIFNEFYVQPERPQDPEIKCELKLRLSNIKPFGYSPRRISYAERAELQILLDEYLSRGFIRASDSEYVSPIVLQSKLPYVGVWGVGNIRPWVSERRRKSIAKDRVI